jgi:hypothetical protein
MGNAGNGRRGIAHSFGNKGKNPKTEITMKTKLHLLILALALLANFPAMAGEKLSDDAIKQKILGYWTGPRWAVQYKSDGLKYSLSTDSRPSQWDVKGGAYYEDSDRYDILILTDKKFAFRYHGGVGVPTTTYTRITKAQAVGK